MEATNVTQHLPEAITSTFLLLQLRIDVERVFVFSFPDTYRSTLLLSAALFQSNKAPKLCQWIEWIDYRVLDRCLIEFESRDSVRSNSTHNEIDIIES